jgi:hypothetical protein
MPIPVSCASREIQKKVIAAGLKELLKKFFDNKLLSPSA